MYMYIYVKFPGQRRGVERVPLSRKEEQKEEMGNRRG